MEPAVPPADSRVALPRTSPEVLAACAQALRAIRARGAEVQAIGVTSALRGEGRSTVAAGLAISDVRSMGRRAVLLDLDSDHRRGHSANESGDHDLPTRVWDLVEWANADLGVLRLGGHLDTSTLTRAQVGGVLAELLHHEVDIIADLACLPPKGSGDEFAGLFDVVVLVVQAGSTSEDEVRRASLSLGEPPVVLLNRTASAIPRFLRGGWR